MTPPVNPPVIFLPRFFPKTVAYPAPDYHIVLIFLVYALPGLMNGG